MNKLKEVKRFIKDPGHADIYENLSVNFIKGHNPDLVLFDDSGAEVERIELNALTTEEIHALVLQKGFAVIPEDQRPPAPVPAEEPPPVQMPTLAHAERAAAMAQAAAAAKVKSDAAKAAKEKIEAAAAAAQAAARAAVEQVRAQTTAEATGEL